MNCDNLSMKSVQLSVVSKCELINSSFYGRFIDVSEILVKAEINLLSKNNRSVAFVVQNNIRNVQGQKVFARFKNIRQWLFRRRRQFALGIYFAVIIHVCLYMQICYYRTSDSVV